jgi:hypothetical protein
MVSPHGQRLTWMSILELFATFALPFSIFLMLASIAGLTVTALAATHERKAVAVWYLLGLAIAIVKIWLLQKAPQWRDASIDSQLYQLHAEALSLHWQGHSIDSRLYQLNGFLNWWASFYSYLWQPNMQISYTSVFGTYEWFYSAVLACWHLITNDWQFWATYSNAAFAGAFPAASYGIGRHLGASPRIATVAAMLALIDPSIGVNASWLLKDTLAGLFAVFAIWATLKTLRTPDQPTTSILCLALAGLSVTRFAAYAAFLLSLVLLLGLFFQRISFQTITHLGISVIGSMVLFGVLFSTPKIPTSSSLLDSAIMPFSAKKQTLVTRDKSNDAYDTSVARWHAHLAEDPVGAITTSVTRTLFSPFPPVGAIINSAAKVLFSSPPWLSASHGLSGTNSIELYYLGMPLWIVCLPGIVWGILICIRIPDGAGFFVACMLLALLSAYVLFLGEWSTRQRVFMLPVFFGYAAIGWHDLYVRSRAFITSRQGKAPFNPKEP